MYAAMIATSADVGSCHPGPTGGAPIVWSPTIGIAVCPTTPMTTVARQAMMVNQTTHGFRRRVASEIAPSTGIDTATRSEEIPLPTATGVFFPTPRSDTSQTAKYNVAMFIEKIV